MENYIFIFKGINVFLKKFELKFDQKVFEGVYIFYFFEKHKGYFWIL